MAVLRVNMYRGSCQSMAAVVEEAEKQGLVILERHADHIVVEKEIDVKPLPGKPYEKRDKQKSSIFWRR